MYIKSTYVSSDLVRGVHACASVRQWSCKMQKTIVAAQEEKQETAHIARANKICVGLTTQNTIGWCLKCWQETVNDRNHWQVVDGWGTAGMLVKEREQREVLEGLISPGTLPDHNSNAKSLPSLMRNALVPKLQSCLERTESCIDWKTLKPVIFSLLIKCRTHRLWTSLKS